MMGMLAQGAALGAGSAVGHMAVRSLMGGGGGGHHEGGADQGMAPAQGGGYAQPQPYYDGQAAAQQQEMMPEPENPCMALNQTLLSCLQQNRGEISLCQQYMDMFTQCERDNMPRYQ